MRYRLGLVCAAFLVLCVTASAKKKKVLLPTEVLQARTAWVIVDPNAGVDVRDPQANNLARGAVENALRRWGRLQPVTDASQADLIIVVRKGNGNIANPTIGGTRANAPPPMTGQNPDSGMNGPGSVRNGPPPFGESEPHPQMEVGDAEDTLSVYRCSHMQDTGNPLQSSPVWRYSGTNALEAPQVPAVDAFRRVVQEAEKQQDAKP
jgi:hypothetical protein